MKNKKQSITFDMNNMSPELQDANLKTMKLIIEASMIYGDPFVQWLIDHLPELYEQFEKYVKENDEPRD